MLVMYNLFVHLEIFCTIFFFYYYYILKRRNLKFMWNIQNIQQKNNNAYSLLLVMDLLAKLPLRYKNKLCYFCFTVFSQIAPPDSITVQQLILARLNLAFFILATFYFSICCFLYSQNVKFLVSQLKFHEFQFGERYKISKIKFNENYVFYCNSLFLHGIELLAFLTKVLRVVDL
eukprot:TRINITY_DN4534_c1_g1_i6.p1 TRINITY_DN4534_c1_g1~~TRINITY_DN4534_c1_g1_i6.p1  ORF type:complete len:175 (+),score=1.61 TRINITY_DN4534_c1_g1_i6:181-705(+)